MTTYVQPPLLGLFLSVAVAVAESNLRVGLDLIAGQKPSEIGRKFRCEARCGDCRGITWLVNVSRIDVALENLPHPWQEPRQLFSAELVPRSPDDDVPILADVEMRVAKTPNIEAFRFAGLRRRWRGRPDDLCFW